MKLFIEFILSVILMKCADRFWNFCNTLIPSTISTFYLASSESPYHLERPVGLGVSDERLQLYLDQYFEVDYTRWTFAAPKSNVYRETDLLRG